MEHIHVELVDEFISYLLKHSKPSNIQSKTKLPCTYCRTTESTTWRPGPVGASTLCNKCGVMYMDSGIRNRTIDLILRNGQPVWLKKDHSTWKWIKDHDADAKDPRINIWCDRESVRHKLTTEHNPPPNKRQRL